MLNRNNCLAFTWDAARRCRGVRLRRAAAQFHLVAAWEATAAEGQSIGECLADGYHALGGDDNCTVAAGPAEWPGGCLDLQLPSLGAAELASAVEFELKRQAPVETESLVWGFRVLRHKGADGLATVRLAFLRATAWRQLLTELSLFKPGLDLLMSPVVALDPALGGFSFAPGDGGARFRPLAAGEVAREWVESTEPVGLPLFGAGVEPLAHPHLILDSKMQALSAERQREYAGALALAMYALIHPAGDGRTWLPVPPDMTVRRHRGPRLVAFALGGYAAACLSLILAVQGVRNVRSLRALRTEIANLQKQIKDTTVNADERVFLDKLRGEFKSAAPGRPALTDCLVELTDRLGDEGWVQLFSWNDGRVELELSSTDPDLDVVKTLQPSTLFREVVPLRKKIEAEGGVSLRLQMQASLGGGDTETGAPPQQEGMP